MGLAALGKAILYFAVSTGLSYAVQEIFAEEYDNLIDDIQKGIRANTRSTKEPLKVLYGEHIVGGNDVFFAQDNYQLDDNRVLYVVTTLSEGECEGIVSIGGEDQIWFGDVIQSEFGNLVTTTFYNGSNTQVYDSALNLVDPFWTDAMINTCYVIQKLIYNDKYFVGLPKRLFRIEGKKVWDWRDDSTVYSRNAVLQMADYMMSDRYGMGIPWSSFNVDTWTSCANYFDTKGWNCDLVLNQKEDASDILNKFLRTFRGGYNWYNNQCYLRYQDYDYESVAFTLRDHHIVQNDDGKSNLKVVEESNFNIPDGIRVKYTDRNRNFVTDPFVVGESNGVLQDLDLSHIQNRDHAAEIALFQLERMKLSRKITGTFTDVCQRLEPYDLIYFNSTQLGIVNQLMRVNTVNVHEDGLVTLGLDFDSLFLYNQQLDVDEDIIYSCSFPSATTPPPSVILTTAPTEEKYSYRGRTFIRLYVDFEIPSGWKSWFDHVEVYISYTGTGSSASWIYLFPATGDFQINDVPDGAVYDVKLVTVTIWGTKQDFDEAYSFNHTIVGVDTAPSSLTELTCNVNQTTITLYALGINEPDIAFYELRLGSSWSGGLFLKRQSYPNFVLAGVRPGIHTFIATTLGHNSLYGENPVTVTAEEIKDPPEGWTASGSYVDYFDENSVITFDNTEVNNSSVGDPYDGYLMCSQDASISDYLTGTYTGPVIDIGSDQRYLVYCLFDYLVQGAGTDWNTKLPPGMSFGEAQFDTKTWDEIFGLGLTPIVNINIYYGSTLNDNSLGSGISSPGVIKNAEIFSGIIEARYLQLHVSITDPQADVHGLISPITLKWAEWV